MRALVWDHCKGADGAAIGHATHDASDGLGEERQALAETQGCGPVSGTWRLGWSGEHRGDWARRDSRDLSQIRGRDPFQ